MGFFGKDKAKRLRDEEEARRKAREAIDQQADCDKLVQALERLKHLKPKWQIDYVNEDSVNEQNIYAASSSLPNGISISVRLVVAMSGHIRSIQQVSASLEIKQNRIDTIDAFLIYEEKFQDYRSSAAKYNPSATKYLANYILAFTKPAFEKARQEKHRMEQEQKTIANDFWGK